MNKFTIVEAVCYMLLLAISVFVYPYSPAVSGAAAGLFSLAVIFGSIRYFSKQRYTLTISYVTVLKYRLLIVSPIVFGLFVYLMNQARGWWSNFFSVIGLVTSFVCVVLVLTANAAETEH
jgi:hypothetical protein